MSLPDFILQPISPSSAHRWMNCTGSMTLADTPLPSGVAAERGTYLHGLAADIMNVNLGNLTATTAMAESSDEDYAEARGAVMQAMGYIENTRKARTHRPKWVVEERIEIDIGDGIVIPAKPDLVGRDAYGIHVFDYKFGWGKVDAVGNEQLMLYALGAMEKYRSTFRNPMWARVRMVVVQPSASREPEVWEVSYADLLDIFQKSMVKFRSYLENPRKPVFDPRLSTCIFCPSIHRCRAVSDKIKETAMAGQKIENAFPPDVVEFRKNCELAVKALAALDERIKRLHANTGETPDGIRIVERASARTWADPKDTDLSGKIGHLAETKPITPAKLEKADPDLYEEVAGHLKESPPIRLVKYSDSKQKGESQ